MAGGTGAANARRAGKYNKPTRGGGKHFSRSLQPVDKDGNLVSIWSKDSRAQSDEDEEDSSSEDEEKVEALDSVGSSKPPAAAIDRDARKAQKKARQQAALAKQNGHIVEPGDLPSSGESDDEADMPANHNHSRAAHSMTQKAADASDDGESANGPPSRREREALEAVAAKERYLKLQAQGKTDEAKADMARLKLIREQREAEAARRQAEKEEKEEQDKMCRAEIEARDAKRREAAAGPKKGGRKK